MKIALEHPNDFIQSSHMLHQTRDIDSIAQDFCAGKNDQTVSSICQSFDCECDFLYRLFISSDFPMHSTKKNLESRNVRKMHSSANNHHRFSFIERRARFCHAFVANNQGLAAENLQRQKMGYFRRVRNRVFVRRNSSNLKKQETNKLTLMVQGMHCKHLASGLQCTLGIDQRYNS